MFKIFSILSFLVVSFFANAMTCKDGANRSLEYDGSLGFAFQNLDASGIPSGIKYSSPDSYFVSVPGSPSYSEYSINSDKIHALVRLTDGGENSTAEVWTKFVGWNPLGAPVFKGKCGSENPMDTSGFGTCYNSLNCSGATVASNVSAAECSGDGGYSLDLNDGSGCINLN